MLMNSLDCLQEVNIKKFDNAIKLNLEYLSCSKDSWSAKWLLDCAKPKATQNKKE